MSTALAVMNTYQILMKILGGLLVGLPLLAIVLLVCKATRKDRD